MTHLIEFWHEPNHVKAVQTTNSLSHHQAFDVHPNQSNPDLIDLLVESFDLPHVPCFLQQVHGNQIIEYTQQPKRQLIHQADACFTRSSHVVCAVLTADCLPVLLTDSVGSFVAAVHCGWRSLFANILTETLKKVNSQHQVLAWLGPHIQQPQYEVDEHFVVNFLKQHPQSHQAFTPIKSGRSQASLSVMARIQLLEMGVTQIETADQCTFLDPNHYSWRQNNTANRMASMLWMTTK
jgi:YfiH family protein